MKENSTLKEVANNYLTHTYTAYKLTNHISECKDGLAIFILIVLFICFVAFTYNAPHIGLFRNPLD